MSLLPVVAQRWVVYAIVVGIGVCSMSVIVSTVVGPLGECAHHEGDKDQEGKLERDEKEY